MRGKAGRGDPPVKYGTGRGKRGRGDDLTCPITHHKCGIAVSGGRPSPSTLHTYRMCAARRPRRSGAASDRKGRPIVVSTSTQHAEEEKEKRKGTSPELKNPQTKEKNQFQLASTDFPGIQWSMRGDELL